MKIIPYGPSSLLIRFAARVDEASFHRGMALIARIERTPPAGLREIVPAFTTVLLRFESAVQMQQARVSVTALTEMEGDERAVELSAARTVEIPTCYDGPDLLRVAEHAKLSVEEVIARHSAPTYRVHCLGFAPGFPYLGGLDPRLHTPRLASPRPRVPAGSVAIGGEHTGVYSIASPGGWNLIGRTDAALFNPCAGSVEKMFLLRAGDRVTFIPVRSEECGMRSEMAASAQGLPAAPEQASLPLLRVLSPGVGLTLQDAGRPGFARFGVPPGGAMDSHAAMWANRLLDNPPDAPVLELCLQDQQFEALHDTWLAVTGSGAPSGHAGNSAFRVRVGERLSFAPGRAGVWTYVAISGGFSAAQILGSTSSNLRAGIGRAYVVGDELGPAAAGRFTPPPAVAGRLVPWDELPAAGSPKPLRVWPGPQRDSFTAADRERFFATTWRASSQCDRAGYRLTGPVLSPDPSQIISEPVLPGSVQVPASGQPIVTMPDGPTLGGYPKLGLVDPADLHLLAQFRAGQEVRFVAAG
jgi:KipI family sensor histidine kinase inhibitor